MLSWTFSILAKNINEKYTHTMFYVCHFCHLLFLTYPTNNLWLPFKFNWCFLHRGNESSVFACCVCFTYDSYDNQTIDQYLTMQNSNCFLHHEYKRSYAGIFDNRTSNNEYDIMHYETFDRCLKLLLYHWDEFFFQLTCWLLAAYIILCC